MKLYAIAVCVALLSATASAQTGTPAEQRNSNPTGSSTSKLPLTPSVIHPGDPDPAMALKPPVTGVTPVVPPPGTPGNGSTVVPK